MHRISETSDAGYLSTIGGNCAADGTITLALGDVKTCTITNDDITPAVVSHSSGGSSYIAPVPPLIDVVKVPNPLALPTGSGVVTYTYSLYNIGKVPVTNITMIDDSCSPAFVSGDTNGDSKLDVSEVWLYRCLNTLTATHMNTVVATGWANGISATDIANATVVVGTPVVPPLIHVTKVPNPLKLTAEGGVVTYTYKITNPGTIALNNIKLFDDKCSSMKYVSGDVNKNFKLETTETFIYTCKTKLTKTTTNTAMATGEANGMLARDFAIATVVVAPAASVIPKLPNTGIAPEENNIALYMIVLAGLLLVSSSVIVAFKKNKV